MGPVKKMTAYAVTAACLLPATVAIAPSANADSRCNKSSHTHGALFWERTDWFYSSWTVSSPRGTMYWHTNSDPKFC